MGFVLLPNVQTSFDSLVSGRHVVIFVCVYSRLWCDFLYLRIPWNLKGLQHTLVKLAVSQRCLMESQPNGDVWQWTPIEAWHCMISMMSLQHTCKACCDLIGQRCLIESHDVWQWTLTKVWYCMISAMGSGHTERQGELTANTGTHWTWSNHSLMSCLPMKCSSHRWQSFRGSVYILVAWKVFLVPTTLYYLKMEPERMFTNK